MEAKESHTKMDKIQYENFKIQSYLTSKLFPERAKLLFKFRTNMSDVKSNFKNMFKEDTLCPLCKVFSDTQEHLLSCEKIHETTMTTIEYNDLFSKNLKKQLNIFTKLEESWEKRRKILEDINNISPKPDY